MSTTMTKDRMRRIDALFSRMTAAEEAIKRDFRELGARADKLAFSFAPAQADQAHDGVGYDAHTFYDAVEGRLQLRGWNRDDVTMRRRAAEEVLIEWQRDNPENIPDPADYRRVIEGFTPSGGDESRPDLLRPKPGVAHPVQASESGGSTAYGRDQQEAELLGGTAGLGEGVRRWHVMQSILRRHQLRRSRPDDYRRALELLFTRENPLADLDKALTFDEAVWCVGRNRKLNFTQAGEQAADLAAEVARRRRDLVTDYKAGRDTPSPGRKPRPDDDAEAVKLTEAARQLCRDEDVPLTESNVYRARCALARRRGGPRYGSRGGD